MVQNRKTLYWITCLGGAAWTLYLFLQSDGVLTHDEIGHLLVAQNSWNFPELILDLWGRCVNTLVYFLPSQGGLTGARWMAFLLASLTVLLATKVANKLGTERLYLIPLFLWFQPWYNSISFTAVTEVPFTFFMVLAVFFWLNDRENWGGLALGLLPLIRHEGAILVAAWGIYFLWRRKWITAISTGVPFIIYNLVYYWTLGVWPFEIYLQAQPNAIYGHGNWFHFFPRVAVKVGLPVIILSLFAIKPIRELKARGYFFYGYLLYFLIHIIIFRFGLFASGGYSYFLLPLAPAFAIAAALGADSVWKNPPSFLKKAFTHEPGQVNKKQLIVSLYIFVTLFTGIVSNPWRLDEQGSALRETAKWMRAANPEAPRIVSTHVWFYYFYDLPWNPQERWDSPPALESLPPGTIVIWDNKYSDMWGMAQKTLSDPENGWQKLSEFGAGIAVVYQKMYN